MVRAVLAVIVGYVVMAVAVAVSFSMLLLALGTERVFEPASYNASGLFNGLALALSLVAALAGGVTAKLIARRERPPMVLAVVVFVLGVLSALGNLGKPDAGARTGNVTPVEAAMKARQPDWYAFAIPVVGAVGVILGARMIRGGRAVEAGA